MGIPFVVGLAGGAGIAYALSSGSGKSSAPAAAPADPVLDIDGNPLPTVNPFKGGKRRRTRRGGKKHGQKKTSRR